MSRKTAVDIEALANPENAGYAVVIPNFAFVAIPDNLGDELEWMYVKLPVQDQLELGLKVGASTLDFWHNTCAKHFPGAHAEMIESYSLVRPVVLTNYLEYQTYYMNIPQLIRSFTTGDLEGIPEVYGNGCHFDCSLLQENSRIQFGDADLWHYSSPQNARTLKGLLSSEEREEMDVLVKHHLQAFVDSMSNTAGYLELHHPLYDAAREALQISYCLSKKQS